MNLVTKPAIDFTARAVMSDGKMCDLTLSKHVAGKYAVLFFYPRDFTFVCPTEILSLHSRIPQFSEQNAEVIAISTDSEFAHSHWRNTPLEKGGIGMVSFPLVADDSHSISESYGMLFAGKVSLRGTIIIDENFVVRHQSVNDLPIGRNVDEFLRIIDAIEHHKKHGEVCPAGWSKGKVAMEATQQGVEHYLQSHIDSLS
ncbi:redoxin domain-containing protein [Anaplasma phagocytophilum str. Norway variant1]|uniref:Thioredoxin peroxidase 1 n=2 Tax=Anaplasma phagocytophilum TaxID=948 RepID=A0A098GM49_ANAPH|nr:peroxiredoxin [Anaplasma phagocytophilum]QLL66748.1 redoxin domain-containing protein [Anaplasma phagocytophilum str. Norway variant1]CEH11127.1 Thioredoxin peroxidase 1 [Anaplasma phagocytophilum]